MNNEIPRSYQYYAFCVKIVVLASLLISVWGMFSFAPTIAKLAYSLMIWGSLILFPWSWIKSNDFPKVGSLLLKGMLCWGIFEILRSLFGFSKDPNVIGNKYATLLLNEYCALLFLPPLFAYTIDKFNILSILFRSSKIYIFGGILFSFLFLKLIAVFRLVTSIIVFWKYVNLQNRMIIIVVYVFALAYAIMGSRVLFIFILYSFAAYFTCYYRDLKKFRKIICLFSVFLPIIFFLPLFSSSAQNKDSGFKVILNFVSEQVGGSKEFKTDTRTFLYLEMALDLTKNDAWLIGKGANSTYYSNYFKNTSGGDHYIRLTTEVPFLLFLLRGGIVYAALYLCFFLLCIYQAVWKGKSKFINCIGIMLAGWFANLFVGDVSGCNFSHLVLFSLCGMTLSPKWLNKTDKEIRYLVNSKSIKRI